MPGLRRPCSAAMPMPMQMDASAHASADGCPCRCQCQSDASVHASVSVDASAGRVVLIDECVPMYAVPVPVTIDASADASANGCQCRRQCRRAPVAVPGQCQSPMPNGCQCRCQCRRLDASVVCRWMPVPMPLASQSVPIGWMPVAVWCRLRAGGDTVSAVVAAGMELLLQLIHIYQKWIKHLQCT